MADKLRIALTDANGVETVLYEPTEKQAEFHSRVEPNVLFWGGRGSGKSMALRWEAHARALSHPGFTYVILRRTYPELQKSHLAHIAREMKQLVGTSTIPIEWRIIQMGQRARLATVRVRKMCSTC